ncbi:MAG TPA: hypothetical protein PKY31_00775 [Spirochaetota bacterium]|nr:hypothetical protein [Spirochaetota bacterium]
MHGITRRARKIWPMQSNVLDKDRIGDYSPPDATGDIIDRKR